MNHTRKRISLVAIATLLAAGSGPLFADSNEYERESESSKRYGHTPDGADTRQLRERERQYPVSGARWKVTDVAMGPDGELSMLQHIVPLKDMAAFGSVTSGITANGLKLASVNAVFNAYDAEVREPHYHFTQRFSVSN